MKESFQALTRVTLFGDIPESLSNDIEDYYKQAFKAHQVLHMDQSMNG